MCLGTNTCLLFIYATNRHPCSNYHQLSLWTLQLPSLLPIYNSFCKHQPKLSFKNINNIRTLPNVQCLNTLRIIYFNSSGPRDIAPALSPTLFCITPCLISKSQLFSFCSTTTPSLFPIRTFPLAVHIACSTCPDPSLAGFFCHSGLSRDICHLLRVGTLVIFLPSVSFFK